MKLVELVKAVEVVEVVGVVGGVGGGVLVEGVMILEGLSLCSSWSRISSSPSLTEQRSHCEWAAWWTS